MTMSDEHARAIELIREARQALSSAFLMNEDRVADDHIGAAMAELDCALDKMRREPAG